MFVLLVLTWMVCIWVWVRQQQRIADIVSTTNHRLATLEAAIERLRGVESGSGTAASTPPITPASARVDPEPPRVAAAPPSRGAAVPHTAPPPAPSLPRTTGVPNPRGAIAPVASPQPPATARRSTDWESMVGANWLNKAGILALVIGVALFLGYSMNHMGPAGRVTVGWLTSAAMLVMGAVVERRAAYRVFGRGFMAGGWAVAYFTAYAMYALPAARVMTSPIAGTLLLFAVAIAIVVHGLRYRSQALTTLTYALAFTTLNLAPLERFTLMASWPLCVSLLYIAWERSWNTLALGGMAAAYSSLFVRMIASSGATIQDPWALQGLLTMHWMAFEGFDLLELRERRLKGLNLLMFPVNAMAFVLLSLLAWSGPRPEAAFYVEAATGTAFALSAWVRSRLLPVSDSAETPLPVADGGFALPLTMAALLYLAALADRLRGTQLAIALTIEAECVLLLGLRLRGVYVRALGMALRLFALLAAIGVALSDTRTMVIAGTTWFQWSAPFAAVAALDWFNARMLSRATPRWAADVYLAAGSLLLTVIVAAESRQPLQSVLWFVLALAFLEIAGRTIFRSLRLHAMLFAVIGFASAVALLQQPTRGDVGALWMCSVLAAVWAWRAHRRLTADTERSLAVGAATFVSVVLAMGATWRTVPEEWLTAAWALLGVTLVAAGFALREPRARRSGLVVLVGAIAKLFAFDARAYDTPSRIVLFVASGAALLAGSWLYTRFTTRGTNDQPGE